MKVPLYGAFNLMAGMLDNIEQLLPHTLSGVFSCHFSDCKKYWFWEEVSFLWKSTKFTRIAQPEFASMYMIESHQKKSTVWKNNSVSKKERKKKAFPEGLKGLKASALKPQMTASLSVQLALTHSFEGRFFRRIIKTESLEGKVITAESIPNNETQLCLLFETLTT